MLVNNLAYRQIYFSAGEADITSTCKALSSEILKKLKLKEKNENLLRYIRFADSLSKFGLL